MAVGRHVTHTGLYVFKGRVNYHEGDKKRLFSDFCLPNPHCVQWEGMVEKRGQWTHVSSDESGYSVQTFP